MTYYDSFVASDNVCCSIDMIRVRWPVDDPEHVYDFLLQLDRRYLIDLHSNTYPISSPRPGKYKYCCSVPCGASSAVLFIGLYDSSCQLTPVAELEYNPNKCLTSPLIATVGAGGMLSTPLRDLLKYIAGISTGEPTVKRIDLATDFWGVPRGLVYSTITGNRRQHIEGSGANRTQSYGTHNSHGHLKIYNKQAESKLDEACTRVELTVDWALLCESGAIDSDLFGVHLVPDLTAADTPYAQLFVMLASVDPVMARDWLSQRDFKTKKKYENLLSEASSRTLCLPAVDESGVALLTWLHESAGKCISPVI